MTGIFGYYLRVYVTANFGEKYDNGEKLMLDSGLLNETAAQCAVICCYVDNWCRTHSGPKRSALPYTRYGTTITTLKKGTISSTKTTKIMKKLLRRPALTALFGRNKKVGTKTTAEIKAWLETHGIDRSTAAHISGFMKAHDIDLGAIRLCSYGLTYSFDEFLEWFKNDDSSLVPVENKFAIFWDKCHSKAKIAVFEGKTDGIMGRFWLSSDGSSHRNCCRFVSMAQYRMILNVPDDMNIPLPLGFLDEVQTKETKKKPAEDEK